MGKPLILATLILLHRENFMRTYYMIMQVEDTQIGTYVDAESIEKAFELAAEKCKKSFPRRYVEGIAAQEMAESCLRD